MRQIKLIMFTLNAYSAYATNRAGADMYGGELRRQRTMAYRDLTIAGLDALKKDLRRPRAPGGPRDDRKRAAR